MSDSTLSFSSSATFRDVLMARNLAPYDVPGVYTPPSGPLNYEVVQTVSNVIDSPDELISNDPFAQQLYPLNEYGPEGGYNLNITYNGPPLPIDSNKGEYSPNDTVLDLVNEFYIDAAYIENRFGPEGGFKDMVIIDNIQNNNKIYLPYWNPPIFTPSVYTPYEILINNNPAGLSQDSFIAKLGAQQLRYLFQERVSSEIFQNTVGLVNLESLSDPFEASLIVTGQEPLVYKNWKITVAENPIIAAADFATRLTGAYWPVSPIPGDYFDENEPNAGASQQTSTALNVVNQLTGGFLGPILNKTRNPSEIFLANTGNGQRSVLFANINYNRYKPDYNKNYGGVLGIGQALVNLAVNLIDPNNGTLVGGYYVGSRNAEPSTITSPPNQVPVNPFGKQEQAPVYGPSELGILYEGNENRINFGLAGKSSTDGGGIDGQFVWTSPKYKGDAGFKATVGGGTGSLDQEFNQISSQYSKSESTNITFKQSSILDQTQRLVDSADNVSGINRLKHVGNAINQVSKVFNDGYKEMTKGSQVVSYKDNTTGDQVGTEYCRVFTKDTPYYTYADLQKTDGITTSGRRFTNSVFDNTYNLNIAPLKNPGSTNIQPNAKGDLVAKKYMFSIENLAWRTSSRPGFTYDELPVCEKGPNGGRVMWFPPYNLSFSDSSSPNFTPTNIMGRPEPIYTYNNTSRSGTLSWKILVDHPSIMNVLVEKQLKGQNSERINSIIDSFFAGCVKYDIYELAKKFNTIPTKDLFTYQEILNNPRLTPEELAGINKEIPKENTADGGPNSSGTGNQNTNTDTAVTPDTFASDFEGKYKELGFYFHNDRPDPNSNSTVASQPFNYWYDIYTEPSFIQKYVNNANAIFAAGSESRNVKEFFDTIIIPNFNTIAKNEKNFIVDAYNILKEKKGTIEITMLGSASAPASVDYNVNLSKRRLDSVKKFFREYKIGDANLAKFIDDKTFKITLEEGKGEELVIPKGDLGTGFQVNCTTNIKDKNGNVTDLSQVYSVNAMACRRVKINNIKVTPIASPTTTTTTATPPPPVVEQPRTENIPVSKPKPTVEVIKKLKEGIAKKILRNLLTECDYFELIKEENPMVYNTFKEKIKYFNPTFHSITPEGLNARLTFLNQCVRPGETIPTIGADGKPKYNDAVNTSFGAPPVLVIRVGDFYHTKAIPTGLQIQYEPITFDMNPEGIGIQPMMANITLSFNIIGGMGLAKPVEQLQNALSFNYYANTEIYDERAVATEDTSALDKEVVDAILASEVPATVNNVDTQQTNDGGSTIGTIITNIPVASGQTGEISYADIMDKLLTETKNYFETVVNKLESTNLQYSYPIVSMLSKEPSFYTGDIFLGDQTSNDPGPNGTKKPVEIFGKSNKVEDYISKEFKSCIENIDNGFNPIIDTLLKKYGFVNSQQKLDGVKNNMKEYISNLEKTFTNGVSTIIQDLTLYQQNYIQLIRKINLVTSKTDGKLLDTSLPRVYSLFCTPEQTGKIGDTTVTVLEELSYDYGRLENAMGLFIPLLKDTDKGFRIGFDPNNYIETGNFKLINQGDFEGGSDQQTYANQNFFLIMCRILTDKNKKNEFINYVIKGDVLNIKDPVNLKNKFENIVDDLEKIYKKELVSEEKIYDKLKKNPTYKDLTEGIDEVMYTPKKTRKCSYTTVPNQNTQIVDFQTKEIRDLYKSVNVDNDDKTYIGKVKFSKT